MKHSKHDNLVLSLKDISKLLEEAIPKIDDNENEYKKAKDCLQTAVSLLNHREAKEIEKVKEVAEVDNIIESAKK